MQEKSASQKSWRAFWVGMCGLSFLIGSTIGALGMVTAKNVCSDPRLQQFAATDTDWSSVAYVESCGVFDAPADESTLIVVDYCDGTTGDRYTPMTADGEVMRSHVFDLGCDKNQ